MALKLDRSPILDDAPSISGDMDFGIREALRADRRPGPRVVASGQDAGAASSLVSSLFQTSVDEIDKVIGKLQDMRKALQEEAERVQRELTAYASTSQAALGSLKAIGDSLAQWKQPSN
jgi:hypothetical protein